MSSAKRHLFIALTFVLAAATFAVLTPRAVHAITATLVQVMNTSANPVPTAESSVRFQAAICTGSGVVSTAVGTCPAGQNTFVVPNITSSGATVKRLVVESVSGICSTYGNSNLFIKSVLLTSQFVPDSVTNTNTAFTRYVPIEAPTYSYINDPSFGPPLGNVQETDYSYGHSTHFTFLPGDTVRMNVYYFYASGSFDGNCLGRVEGYLVTQ